MVLATVSKIQNKVDGIIIYESSWNKNITKLAHQKSGENCYKNCFENNTKVMSSVFKKTGTLKHWKFEKLMAIKIFQIFQKHSTGACKRKV